MKSTSPSCLGELMLKRLAGQLEDALTDALEFLPESRRKTVKHSCVDADAALLHAIKHRREGQVDLVVDARRLPTFSASSRSDGTSAWMAAAAAGSEDGR